MLWKRRRTRRAEPSSERLPDLAFLALVRERLEEYAPGVTRGAELRGNSLLSPSGWAVGVAPPDDAGSHRYDLIVFPDVSVQPDVPCFVDHVVAPGGNPRHAIDGWVETAGACLLELLDRGERFAHHAGPDHGHGVPGWHSIISGVVGLGLDTAENRRLQVALLDANVLHHVAGSMTADLESPFFNGVKVFYGGSPGTMEAEIRVNGVRHEAASAALAALDLPEPSTFTTVRQYALLLPLPPGAAEPTYPATRLDLTPPEHAHGAACGCCGNLDPEQPGFDLAWPHPVAELPEEERARRVTADTGAIMIVDGVGNFLKVRLPVRLEDGRTVVYLVWALLQPRVFEDFIDRVRDDRLTGHRFEGLLANGVSPWGEELLRAPVVLGGQQVDEDGSIRRPEVLESDQPLLAEVLRKRWPAEFVLGDRDPRLSAG
ncbi:DUF6348 family protein [Kitasatospora sp. NPDC094015]|uniref:DUF6348 family protein n=1 Tax=Kitasatospora sp. NPDC094015 TaxID=3155205 RepID=UPI00332D64D4